MITPTLDPAAHAPSAEDQARAGFYGLLANLLAAPPDAALLGALGAAEPLAVDPAIPEAARLARGWDALRAAAGQADPAELRREWNALFGGIGRPAVVLHGSWYLSGFLMEKPLALLRDDLAALGLARQQCCGDSEDHLAALCDAMRALLVDGRRSAGAREAAQKSFFDRHVKPWGGACCAALEAAPAAGFYKAVARFAGDFLGVEARAMEIES